MADGLCLVNGGPGVHLLNDAIARVGHHPGWGCFLCLGEIGKHRPRAVVIDEVILHALGPGDRDEEAKGAAGDGNGRPWTPLKVELQTLKNHGGCTSAAILTDFRGWVASGAWLVRQGLIQEATVKAIIKARAWSPPAIARFYLPVVALGSGGPGPIGPVKAVDGDGHAIACRGLGWESLLGW